MMTMEEMTLEEYKNSFRGGTHRHKIKNSYGVRDYFDYYRKNKPKGKKYVLKDVQYYKIIRQVNNKLAEVLLEGDKVTLPARMGGLEIRKSKTYVTLDKNNKIKTDRPVDWSSTLQLWYEDEGARLKKTLVRTSNKEVYRFCYSKYKANYTNQIYFIFKFNRSLKSALRDKIRAGEIDVPYIASDLRKYYSVKDIK